MVFIDLLLAHSIITDMVIGISGKACSGKDRVSAIFERNGYLVLNADLLGIEALKDSYDEVVLQFGSSIITDGKVDRKKLGALVFSDRKALAALNAISHPYILEKIHQTISDHLEDDIVVNAALLPYWKIDQIDALIWVRSCVLLRLYRSLKRDKRGLLFSIKRMLNQLALSPKLFFKKVDTYSIRNNLSMGCLETKTMKVLKCIEKR